jgi:4-amino-4-deoxy-L-arabinose transferase-like glycosyltransferase
MKRALEKAGTSLLLIVMVALAVRVVFAWSQARKIPDSVIGIVPFQTETGHIAYSVASGKGYSSPYERDTGPTAWLAPVYPLLVAGIFKVFGIYTRASFIAAVILNILCSAATCVPIFYLGRRVCGSGIGALAAWMWAVFPNAVMIPFEWVWDTSLAALLAATLLWFTAELAERKQWRHWLAYGLLWGLALMTNPALGAALPFLLGWLIWADRRKPATTSVLSEQRTWLRPAVALGLALLCCVPWTVRNFLVFHRFIPLRSNLGFELYVGNNENYDEHRRGLPATVTDEREILRYLRMGEMPFVDEEMHKATEFIRTHPRVEVELTAKRMVAFWIGTAQPIAAFRSTDSWLARAVLLGNFLTWLGAIAGAVILFWRRSLYAFPVAAFVAAVPVLYYITHTSLRYRHPMDPIVLLLTAIALGAISGRGELSTWRKSH